MTHPRQPCPFPCILPPDTLILRTRSGGITFDGEPKSTHGVSIALSEATPTESAGVSPPGPCLNASGWRLIVRAPCSNARCVLAMYASRLGAARSVLTDSRPSW